MNLTRSSLFVENYGVGERSVRTVHVFGICTLWFVICAQLRNIIKFVCMCSVVANDGAANCGEV